MALTLDITGQVGAVVSGVVGHMWDAHSQILLIGLAGALLEVAVLGFIWIRRSMQVADMVRPDVDLVEAMPVGMQPVELPAEYSSIDAAELWEIDYAAMEEYQREAGLHA